MNSKVKELNGEALKSIANANPTSEVLMTHLALRQRNRLFSNLGATRLMLLRKNEKIEDRDYKGFWKSLEEAGIGSYTRGKGENSGKFTWNYSLKAIAEAALTGKNVKMEPIHFKAKPARPVTLHRVSKRAKGEVLRAGRISVKSEKILSIKLRPDFSAEIRVPQDFSKREADSLYKSLAAIAK